jgi:tRNA-5-methyluridine54 2-sulfurtransferase
VRCRRCQAPAIIEIRRHNAGFCAECFLRHCREQVVRAIDDFHMFARGQRVLVAVSGGKDSLALWDILLDLGYLADGLYVGLGIGEPGGYSEASAAHALAFASNRRARLIALDLPTGYGFDIPGAAATARRVPCSACGLSKRHLFNQAARDGGYDALATGHNLDDEAAVLFGNVLRWNTDYLGRQLPVLPGGDGFVRKVKPLVRLGEREMAAYCVVRGIDYIVEECPMAAGNRHLAYKEALNDIEVQSPGSKQAFYFGFLERASPHFQASAATERVGIHPCPSCGSPTTAGSVCAFCSLISRAIAPEAAEPVAVGPPRRRRP